jgi:SHS2 domain-containing protein
MAPFHVLDHTADTGLEVSAPDFASLLVEASRGMTALVFGPQAAGAVPAGTVVRAEADSAAGLLAAWLEELLVVAEAGELALTDFVVDGLEEQAVTGRVGGQPAGAIPLVGPPIKAVTYHGLQVIEAPDGTWQARIYFDV